MLKNFNSYKKKITFYSIIYWIISWGIVSIIINVIGNLIFEVEYGSSDSAITDLYSLVSIGLSLYFATKFTKKFRIKKYSNWLSENLDEKDPDLKAVMVKLMSMNVIDKSSVSDSDLEVESKTFITDFSYDNNNRVEALKEKYNVKINENGLCVLPYIYTVGYMISTLLGSFLLSFFTTKQLFHLLGFNEQQSGYFIIPFFIFMGLFIYLFYKLSAKLNVLLKGKALININKNGINYENRFFNWENIKLQDFITDFENLDTRSNFVDLKFSYNNEVIHLNFRTVQILFIYSYILYYSERTIQNNDIIKSVSL